MGRIKKGRLRRTPKRYKGDGYISDYNRNIWMEYGTLSNRAAGHSFKSARRRKSAHWRGGIKPLLATERSWRSSSGVVKSAIIVETRKRAEAFNRKYQTGNL